MAKKRANFIDAHNHLSLEWYKDDNEIETIINQAKKNNIEFMIVNGGHQKSNVEVIELSKKYNIVKAVIGIHPEDITKKDDYKKIINLIDEKICGIGEIGLDYFYENAPERQIQIFNMEQQLIIAKKYNLPVVVHIRDKEGEEKAISDVYDLIKKHSPIKSMLHTYAGNLEWAKKFLKLDCYFSFSGTITFGSNDIGREVVKYLPLNRILTETDSPYLRVHPYTGEKNEPNTVLFVSYYIAGLKCIGMEKFVSNVNRNLRELFKLN